MSRATWTCVQTSKLCCLHTRQQIFLRSCWRQSKEGKKEKEKEKKKKSAREGVQPWNSQNTRVLTVVLCRWWEPSKHLSFFLSSLWAFFSLSLSLSILFSCIYNPFKVRQLHCSLPHPHHGQNEQYLDEWSGVRHLQLVESYSCLLLVATHKDFFAHSYTLPSVYLAVCRYKFSPTKVWAQLGQHILKERSSVLLYSSLEEGRRSWETAVSHLVKMMRGSH